MTGFQGPLDTRPLRSPTVQTREYIAEAEVSLSSQSKTGEGTAHGMRIDQLQQQVGKGEYQVDAQAVADAILRRILGAGGRVAVAPDAATD
jgi:anti-sigma28 factor (negative regulator of flagellin synthesis)